MKEPLLPSAGLIHCGDLALADAKAKRSNKALPAQGHGLTEVRARRNEVWAPHEICSDGTEDSDG